MTYTVDRRPGASTDEASGLMLYAVGWKDLLSSLSAGKAVGANAPTWTTAMDAIAGYAFSATIMQEMWINFHVGHDYAPGTDMYPHVHFMPTSDEVQGTVRWGIEYTYADRTTGVFPASTTVYIEQVIPANSQYTHFVTETAEDAPISGAGDVLNVDGVFMFRIFRDAAHVNDTYAGTVIGLFADLHYQSDRDTTKNRVEDFYV